MAEQYHPTTSIENAQQIVDNWIKQIGGSYFSELTNMSLLMEEVGELARIMARTFGDQIPKKNENASSIEEEIADIFFVLICLCNQTGINLTEAFHKSIQKKTERDKNRFLPD